MFHRTFPQLLGASWKKQSDCHKDEQSHFRGKEACCPAHWPGACARRMSRPIPTGHTAGCGELPTLQMKCRVQDDVTAGRVFICLARG